MLNLLLIDTTSYSTTEVLRQLHVLESSLEYLEMGGSIGISTGGWGEDITVNAPFIGITSS
jgi:predicted O-methyltransferase YrrM